MLFLPGENKISLWFKDLGGTIFRNEFNNYGFELRDRLEEILLSDKFEEYFKEILQDMLPSGFEIRYKKTDKQQIAMIPAYGKIYALAGQLAIAKCMNMPITFACDLREYARIIADSARKSNIRCNAVLSDALNRDEELMNELKEKGCEFPFGDICSLTSDYPSEYIYMDEKNSFGVSLYANTMYFPYDGLIGMLAALYGKEVRAKLKWKPDCVVVPIREGTEALALFKSFEDECGLDSCEELVSAEYRLRGSISTRSSRKEQPNTVLCPELVSLWRQAKVRRLGCDRMQKVHTEAYRDLNLNDTTLRALVLSLEENDAQNILLMEAEDE